MTGRRSSRRLLRSSAIAAVAASLLGVGLSGAVAAPRSRPALAASQLADPKYVAIGDSFAAGGSIEPLDPTDEACGGRSLRNYPHQVAEAKDWDITDTSCNGATLKKGVWGSGRGGFWESIDGGRTPAVIDEVNAGTKYVTFQMGGNDSGVSNTFLTCINDGTDRDFGGTGRGNDPQGTSCKDRSENGERNYQFDIPGAQEEIQKALLEIHKRAPQAQVAVVGYPAVIPQNVTRCHFYTDPIPFLRNGLGPVSHGDLAWLRGKFEAFNASVEDTVTGLAAKEPNFAVTYVNTYDHFKGHEPCQPASPNRWIWPVPAPRTNPDYALWGAAHPNEYGHNELAHLVSAALPIAER
ncbi:SGNH/GDSL hydrolase family protein [Streptomyces sp. BE133]|uniref:SGNH/GDSL hydrolase family protein n=1 Tax=Streptomyces sp. BE133 TaxID=3002523 RepID=UPI002E79E329|nr:SGNH/GDSL hydrolase family protein [Streptomyces sp. BE133]MEE1811808.1 SGNH/GDSL hydrolase family protein [Streptomyces sp. BE133]